MLPCSFPQLPTDGATRPHAPRTAFWLADNPARVIAILRKMISREHEALFTALALYTGLAQPKVAWQLPEQWGLWFHHKHPSPDPFISPDTIGKMRHQLQQCA